MKNGKNSVKRRDWKMATGASQQTSTLTQQQLGNVSSISISNGTATNGSITISNLGNYYTTAGTSISNAVWGVYTNFMKPKTFKLR